MLFSPAVCVFFLPKSSSNMVEDTGPVLVFLYRCGVQKCVLQRCLS